MANLKDKKVVLVDGSGFIFRAFYAFPADMTRPIDHLHVNALYGFCVLLGKLIREFEADYIAVVFDASRQTFRQEIYPEYKSNRPPVPEELVPQFKLIREAVNAFDVAWIEMDGYEADDLLATYANMTAEQGGQAIVVSSDKDLMQLMRPGVALFDPMKHKYVTEEDVLKKFYTTPDKVVEVQALWGDATDNVPGIRGLGPKTAGKYINEYGSLENLYAHLDELKEGKAKSLLAEFKEDAFISKQLVSLKKDVPVSKGLSEFERKEINPIKLNAFYQTNGFKSLMISCIEEKRSYEQISSSKELEEFVKKIKDAGLFAFDVVLNQGVAKGIAISVQKNEAFYIPFNETPAQVSLFDIPKGLPFSEVERLIYPLFSDKSVLKIAHDLKTAWHGLSAVKNVEFNNYDDTALMVYNQDGNLLSVDFEKRVLQDVGINIMPVKKLTDYSDLTPIFCQRADGVFQLYQNIKTRPTSDLYKTMDLPLLPVLYHMEQTGIKIDPAQLRQLSTLYEQKLNELTDLIYEASGQVGWNINSPKQLGEILFDVMQLPNGGKSKTGSYKTDSDTLEELADNFPIVQYVLEYRQISKLKSTYSDALQELYDKKTQRVHTTFSEVSTSTGRLSSNSPNLQNIPVRTEAGRAIRQTFIAEKGCVLISADYSQVELRLLASMAKVEGLKQAFLSGEDIHARTACEVFQVSPENLTPVLRRQAKAINFGIVYGISGFGLAKQLGIDSKSAKKYIDFYFERYPEIKQYMADTIKFAEENEFVLTADGRKCYVAGINDKRMKAFASRAAINAPIQGTAADIMKKVMIALPEQLKPFDAKMLLQVHDEVIIECPEKNAEQVASLVKSIMEKMANLDIPLVAETGIAKTWADAH